MTNPQNNNHAIQQERKDRGMKQVTLWIHETEKEDWKRLAKVWTGGKLSSLIKMSVRRFKQEKDSEQQEREEREYQESLLGMVEDKLNQFRDELARKDAETLALEPLGENHHYQMIYLFVKANPGQTWNELKRNIETDLQIDEITLDDIITRLKADGKVELDEKGGHVAK